MAILTIMALIVFVVSMVPAFSHASLKALRGILFGIFGISVSIPLLYLMNFQ